MNKQEYIEILVDYLNQHSISQEERNDILRDVNEMITDGVQEGKIEEEVVSSLGSPKELVKELRGADKGLNIEVCGNKNNDNDKCKSGVGKRKFCKEKEVLERFLKNTLKLMLNGTGLMVTLPVIMTLILGIVGLLIAIGFGIAGVIILSSANTPLAACSFFGTIICFGFVMISIQLCSYGKKVSISMFNKIREVLFVRGRK